MKVLLDTHFLIWMFCDSKRISKKISRILLDGNNEIFFSDISLFEIAIKFGLKKLELSGGTPEDLFKEIESSFLIRHPLIPAEIVSFYSLQIKHKDPFDRMLIWQAMLNGFHFLTADNTIHQNEPDNLKLLK